MENSLTETFAYMYGGALYKKDVPPMPEGKNVSVSFRVSPRFKCLLETAASRERRSQTNMLEALLYAYCEEHGLENAPVKKTKNKTGEGDLSK